MKRAILRMALVSLIMLVMGCAGGAKAAANPGGLTLDQAVKEAAVRIDERLAAGTKIAPLNFNSPPRQVFRLRAGRIDGKPGGQRQTYRC
jgi:hypothetical protein